MIADVVSAVEVVEVTPNLTYQTETIEILVEYTKMILILVSFGDFFSERQLTIKINGVFIFFLKTESFT